jgi:hypothetical protein
MDPVLAERLEGIERKLDRILAALDENSPLPLCERDARDVSISGAGIGVDVGNPLAPNGAVLVEILLPERPNRHVRAIARPVENGGSDSQPVAFVFEEIAEDDRDAIVRFSQEMQRSTLRERAKGKPAS